MFRKLVDAFRRGYQDRPFSESLPDSPLAAKYPAAATAVRVCEYGEVGAFKWGTVNAAPGIARSPDRVAAAVQMLKDIADVGLAHRPDAALLAEARAQMDTADFGEYVREKLSGKAPA